jgi:hypothetical protein
VEDVEENLCQQISHGNFDVIALLVAEDDEKSMGEYLLLMKSGSHYKRVGIARCPAMYDLTVTKAESFSKDFDALQRFDSDFIARSIRRTVILE